MALTEYETAMLALREREVAALEKQNELALQGVAAVGAMPTNSEEDLWLAYASARCHSQWARTASEVRDFANDMLKHHLARFPRAASSSTTGQGSA